MKQTKICSASGQKFIITDEDLVFYEKMGVPTPTLCPKERQRRRLSWQNMYKLYWRTCDATGNKMLSNISPDKPYTVYQNEYWWSDKWDVRDYGQEPDFTKPFFEQMGTLLKKVPYPNMFVEYQTDENSEFTNFAGGNKDCYLIFHADGNRECFYGTGIKKCQNVIDIFNVFDSELCYECIDCRSGYNLKFSQDCENCSDAWFLKNCIGCKNCFGCINLRQKQYYLFNKSVGKEAYEKFMKEFQSGKHSVISKIHQQFIDFQATQPHRATQGYQNEDCTGDHIFRSQNVKDCFDVQESRDMRYCERVYNGPNSDCYDIDQFGMKIQKVYEAGPVGLNCVNVITAPMVYTCTDTFYSTLTYNSKDCLGCVGLYRGKNTLFNKTYTTHEYEALRDKMISHMKETKEWGEFFPVHLSPWAYNETLAQEYYPLEKAEALAKKYLWKDDVLTNEATSVQTSNPSSKNSENPEPRFLILDDIADASEDICQQVLHCETTNRAYRIQPAELKFYRQQNLPIPRQHPDVRHANRVKLRNPRQLHHRSCGECEKDIQTTYAADRPEKVLCEECYLKVVN
jgi:hypothetical protein